MAGASGQSTDSISSHEKDMTKMKSVSMLHHLVKEASPPPKALEPSQKKVQNHGKSQRLGSSQVKQCLLNMTEDCHVQELSSRGWLPWDQTRQ